MPIRPENKHRYPKNWKEIRAQILERAENCCECCHVPNRKVIYRAKDADGEWWWAIKGDTEKCPFGDSFEIIIEVKIVLTIAHLDHTPENNSPDNLRAWCQRCHNRYDAKHRAANRKARMAK